MSAPSERGGGRGQTRRKGGPGSSAAMTPPQPAVPAKAAPKAQAKAKVVVRSEWRCRGCKIAGTAKNEFSGCSAHAVHELVVLAKGTQEKPRGDVCMKCFMTFLTAGWCEEYDDDIDRFLNEKDKDDDLNECFIHTTGLLLEAHNSGKRIREVKSDKHKKRGAGSLFLALQSARTTRKRICKTKKRGLKAINKLKFCTPNAYKARFGRTCEDDGNLPSWHMIKGTKHWGTLVDMNEDGEIDLEDYEDVGVELEEEVESGGDDELRVGQTEAKYKHIASGLDETLNAAVRVALEVGGASQASSKEESADEGSDADESDDDIVIPPMCQPLAGAVFAPPTLKVATPAPPAARRVSAKPGFQKSHVAHASAFGSKKPLARTGASSAADRSHVAHTAPSPDSGSRKAVQSLDFPPIAVDRSQGKTDVANGSKETPAPPAPPAAEVEQPTSVTSVTDELASVDFAAVQKACKEELNKLQVAELAGLCCTLVEKSEAKAIFTKSAKSLGDVIAMISKAEHSLKRRRVVNEAAVAEVGDSKQGVTNVQRLLNTLATGKGDCETAVAAIESTPIRSMWELPLVILFAILQHNVLETIRFGRYEDLEILLGDKNILTASLPAEGIMSANEKIAEMCLTKAAPRVGRACKTASELSESLIKLASVMSKSGILPAASAKSFESLRIALTSTGEATLDDTQRSLTELEALSSDAGKENDILYPLLQLNTFKDLIKAAAKEAHARIRTLTKSQTLVDLGNQLTPLEATGKPYVKDGQLHQALLAAAGYVRTWEASHSDVSKFAFLVDRLLNIASLLSSIADC